MLDVMSHQAILFDMDGTLLNTIDDLSDSMDLMLGELGAPLHDTAAYKTFIGDGIEKLVQRALPAGRRDAETITRCVARVRHFYSQRWHDKTRPYDGIPELLDALVRRGVKLAILSNKPDGPTRQLAEHLLGRWPFDPVHGARPDVPVKPDPTAALQMADALQVPPARCLFVGDTGTDISTARAAGMTGVGVTWGFRPAAELQRAGAHHLIDRPALLLDLL